MIAFGVQFVAQGLLERGLVAFLVQRPLPPRREQIATAVGVQLVSGVLATAVFVVAARPAAEWFGVPDLAPLLYAAGATMVPYALRAVPLGLLERELRYAPVGAVEVVDLLAFNTIAVSAVLLGSGLEGVAFAVAARGLLSSALAWMLARPPVAAQLSVSTLREIRAFALPFAASSALGWLNGLAAPLLVGTFAGPRALGHLALAQTLIAYPQVLSAIFSRVALAVYSRTPDDVQLRSSVSWAVNALFRYVGGATIALAATAPLWIPSLYGAEWIDAAAYMLMVAPALALGLPLTIVMAAINARGHARLALCVNAAFQAAYWLLAIVLVPLVGATAIPLAYALSAPVLALYIVAFRRTVGVLEIAPGLWDMAAFATLLLASAALWMIVGDAVLAALVGAGVAALALRSPHNAAAVLRSAR